VPRVRTAHPSCAMIHERAAWIRFTGEVTSSGMDIGRLVRLYDRLASASAMGDDVSARQTFLAIAGLLPPEGLPNGPSHTRQCRASVLRYSVPRRIDIVALKHGARAAAKFEDLSSSRAALLARSFTAQGLHVQTVGPYQKRFDLSLTEPGSGVERYAVIASRGLEAEAIVEAERDRSPAGTFAAGVALGYPTCCVRHFVELEQSDRAAEDGINEAAIRSPAGIRGRIPWQMNPLNAFSPIGFTPCSVNCRAARVLAERVLSALRAESQMAHAAVRRALMRPVLFFRYAIFYVLDGCPVHLGEVRYTRAVAAMESLAPRFISTWQDQLIGSRLVAGDTIRLTEDALEVSRDGKQSARWNLDARRVPLLLQFYDEPEPC